MHLPRFIRITGLKDGEKRPLLEVSDDDRLLDALEVFLVEHPVPVNIQNEMA